MAAKPAPSERSEELASASSRHRRYAVRSTRGAIDAERGPDRALLASQARCPRFTPSPTTDGPVCVAGEPGHATNCHRRFVVVALADMDTEACAGKSLAQRSLLVPMATVRSPALTAGIAQAVGRLRRQRVGSLKAKSSSPDDLVTHHLASKKTYSQARTTGFAYS